VAYGSIAQCARWACAHGAFLILLAAPGAYALVGLLEAFSGRPFRDSEQKGTTQVVATWRVGRAVAAIAFVLFMLSLSPYLREWCYGETRDA